MPSASAAGSRAGHDDAEIADCLRRIADVGGDAGSTASHRLDQHVRRPFAEGRRGDAEVEGAVDRGHVGAVPGPDQAIAQPEPLDQRRDLDPARRTGRCRRSRSGHRRASAATRAAASRKVGWSFCGSIRPIRPINSSSGRTPHSARNAFAAASSRWKRVEVDAVGDHGHLRGRISEPSGVALAGVAVGDDQVRQAAQAALQPGVDSRDPVVAAEVDVRSANTPDDLRAVYRPGQGEQGIGKTEIAVDDVGRSRRSTRRRRNRKPGRSQRPVLSSEMIRTPVRRGIGQHAAARVEGDQGDLVAPALQTADEIDQLALGPAELALHPLDILEPVQE